MYKYIICILLIIGLFGSASIAQAEDVQTGGTGMGPEEDRTNYNEGIEIAHRCGDGTIRIGDTGRKVITYCGSPDVLDKQYEFKAWAIAMRPPTTHITVVEHFVWIYYEIDRLELRRKVTVVTISGHTGDVIGIRIIE